MSIENIKSDRNKKLEILKTAGIEPYPAQMPRARRDICSIHERFDEIVEKKEQITAAGRIKLIRSHGGSAFADLEDGTGKIQIYFKKDELGDKEYEFFLANFDMGDFMEVTGGLFATQKGEKTILIKKYRILAKALNQLPDKWHGLTDVEERFRKRYLDILMNKEVKGRFCRRAEIIKNLRLFLETKGFMEVETPILQPIPGGALARPFKTHLNALGLDLYLRVAPELYLKELLVAGYNKVYELGRCFRNEGMDKSHNPDFTMLEFYWAYADYDMMMQLTEELFSFLVPEMEIEYQGQKINFAPPFRRVSMHDLILENYMIDIKTARKETVADILKKAGQKVEENWEHCQLIDELFKTIRSKIIQPTFVINHPLEMSPLAKANSENKEEAARFQLLVAGMEMANAYSELNDPLEQAARMREQERQRAKDEIQRFDKDYIEALEFGMPPAAGFGMGLDRLAMLLTNAANIREVILFPAMRQKE